MYKEALQAGYRFIHRFAGAITLGGVIWSAWRNWKQWQNDKASFAGRSSRSIPPLADWPEPPLVSILIAAWNEAQWIDQNLQSVLQLDYPQKEIIVCAGGEDGTYQLLDRWEAQITILPQFPGEGKQHALERCLQIAQGEILVFVDADSVVNSESFRRLIYPLVAEGELAASGVARPFPDQQKNGFVCYQWAFRNYPEATSGSTYTHSVYGSNFALHRSILARVWPGFIARIGEDLLLGTRIRQNRIPIRYVYDSYVETDFPTTFLTYVRQSNRDLRAHILTGIQCQDQGMLRGALAAVLTGLGALMAPFSIRWLGRVGLASWIIVWSTVAMRRTRYLMLLSEDQKEVTNPLSPALLKFMLATFLSWPWVLIQLWHPSWRTRWM